MFQFSTTGRVSGLRQRAVLHGSASAAAVIVAALATPAFAQEQAPEEVATQDIVVTAQRREEKLSRVPVAVVAYGAEALQTCSQSQ